MCPGFVNNFPFGLMNRIVFQPPALQLKGHVSLMYSVRAFKAKRPRGYAQQYVLTVARIVTHPAVLCQDQTLEVSGADFFLASLSRLSLYLIWFMSNIRMFWTLFFISRRAETSCVWEVRRQRLCLPNGAKWLLPCASWGIVFSFFFFFLYWHALPLVTCTNLQNLS